MAAVRGTTAAVAVACALALVTAGYAGADPLDDLDGTDSADSAEFSPADVTDDLTDDTGTGNDPASDQPGGTGTGSPSGAQGIDLDNPVTEKELVYVTDYLVFQARMSDFQHVRRQRLLSDQLTWNAAACDTALRDPVDGFQEACERREFGYRNFARQDRFDSGMRDRVDKRFKRELRERCDDGKDLVARTVCERQADLYFGAFGTI